MIQFDEHIFQMGLKPPTTEQSTQLCKKVFPTHLRKDFDLQTSYDQIFLDISCKSRAFLILILMVILGWISCSAVHRDTRDETCKLRLLVQYLVIVDSCTAVPPDTPGRASDDSGRDLQSSDLREDCSQRGSKPQVVQQQKSGKLLAGRWIQIFSIFTFIWGRFPIWRIFSDGLVQPPTNWGGLAEKRLATGPSGWKVIVTIVS